MQPRANCSSKAALRATLPDDRKIRADSLEQAPRPRIVARQQNKSDQQQWYAGKKRHDDTYDSDDHRKPSEYEQEDSTHCDSHQISLRLEIAASTSPRFQARLPSAPRPS